MGPAGTGKSQRVFEVCNRFGGIKHVIDDGLLLREGLIIAGTSAKEETSKIRAVRRAIFDFEDHRREVALALERENPESVLVVATSEAMARRICSRLNLPMPSAVVRIDEVASPREIEEALRARREKGSHVVPVPKVELRKRFLGKLVDSIRFWKFWPNGELVEKTIVRPPFSFYGKLVISPLAVEQLVERTLLNVSWVEEIVDLSVDGGGVERPLEVRVSLVLKLVGPVHLYARRARDLIYRAITFFFGLKVDRIEVLISGVRVVDRSRFSRRAARGDGLEEKAPLPLGGDEARGRGLQALRAAQR